MLVKKGITYVIGDMTRSTATVWMYMTLTLWTLVRCQTSTTTTATASTIKLSPDAVTTTFATSLDMTSILNPTSSLSKGSNLSPTAFSSNTIPSDTKEQSKDISLTTLRSSGLLTSSLDSVTLSTSTSATSAFTSIVTPSLSSTVILTASSSVQSSYVKSTSVLQSSSKVGSFSNSGTLLPSALSTSTTTSVFSTPLSTPSNSASMLSGWLNVSAVSSSNVLIDSVASSTSSLVSVIPTDSTIQQSKVSVQDTMINSTVLSPTSSISIASKTVDIHSSNVSAKNSEMLSSVSSKTTSLSMNSASSLTQITASSTVLSVPELSSIAVEQTQMRSSVASTDTPILATVSTSILETPITSSTSIALSAVSSIHATSVVDSTLQLSKNIQTSVQLNTTSDKSNKVSSIIFQSDTNSVLFSTKASSTSRSSEFSSKPLTPNESRVSVVSSTQTTLLTASVSDSSKSNIPVSSANNSSIIEATSAVRSDAYISTVTILASSEFSTPSITIDSSSKQITSSLSGTMTAKVSQTSYKSLTSHLQPSSSFADVSVVEVSSFLSLDSISSFRSLTTLSQSSVVPSVSSQTSITYISSSPITQTISVIQPTSTASVYSSQSMLHTVTNASIISDSVSANISSVSKSTVLASISNSSSSNILPNSYSLFSSFSSESNIESARQVSTMAITSSNWPSLSDLVMPSKMTSSLVSLAFLPTKSFLNFTEVNPTVTSLSFITSTVLSTVSATFSQSSLVSELNNTEVATHSISQSYHLSSPSFRTVNSSIFPFSTIDASLSMHTSLFMTASTLSRPTFVTSRTALSTTLDRSSLISIISTMLSFSPPPPSVTISGSSSSSVIDINPSNVINASQSVLTTLMTPSLKTLSFSGSSLQVSNTLSLSFSINASKSSSLSSVSLGTYSSLSFYTSIPESISASASLITTHLPSTINTNSTTFETRVTPTFPSSMSTNLLTPSFSLVRSTITPPLVSSLDYSIPLPTILPTLSQDFNSTAISTSPLPSSVTKLQTITPSVSTVPTSKGSIFSSENITVSIAPTTLLASINGSTPGTSQQPNITATISINSTELATQPNISSGIISSSAVTVSSTSVIRSSVTVSLPSVSSVTPTASASVTTPPPPQPTTPVNATTARESFWVKTVIKVRRDVDVSKASFKQELEGRLANVFNEAFLREKQIADGTFQPLERRRRRKRYTTVGDASVHIHEITRNSGTTAVTAVYTVEKNGDVMTAPDAVKSLDVLDTQEVAIILKHVVASQGEAYVEPLVENDVQTSASQLWLIGAIAGPVVAIFLIVWVILCIYFKCCKRPEKTPEEGEPQLTSLYQQAQMQSKNPGTTSGPGPSALKKQPSKSTLKSPKAGSYAVTVVDDMEQTPTKRGYELNPPDDHDPILAYQEPEGVSRRRTPPSSADIEKRLLAEMDKPIQNGTVVMDTQVQLPRAKAKRRSRKTSLERSAAVREYPDDGHRTSGPLTDRSQLLQSSISDDNEELKERAKLERRKNKERLREKRRKEKGTSESNADYVTAQNEINYVLGMPNTTLPSVLIERENMNTRADTKFRLPEIERFNEFDVRCERSSSSEETDECASGKPASNMATTCKAQKDDALAVHPRELAKTLSMLGRLNETDIDNQIIDRCLTLGQHFIKWEHELGPHHQREFRTIRGVKYQQNVLKCVPPRAKTSNLPSNVANITIKLNDCILMAPEQVDHKYDTDTDSPEVPVDRVLMEDYDGGSEITDCDEDLPDDDECLNIPYEDRSTPKAMSFASVYGECKRGSPVDGGGGNISRQDSGVSNGNLSGDETLTEARKRMHKLLDDAFSLISPRNSYTENELNAIRKVQEFAERHQNKVAPVTPQSLNVQDLSDSKSNLIEEPKGRDIEHQPMYVNPAFEGCYSDYMETWDPYRAYDHVAMISLPQAEPTRLGRKNKTEQRPVSSRPSRRPAANFDFPESKSTSVIDQSKYAKHSPKPIVLRTKDAFETPSERPQSNKVLNGNPHNKKYSMTGINGDVYLTNSTTSFSKPSSGGRHNDAFEMQPITGRGSSISRHRAPSNDLRNSDETDVINSVDADQSSQTIRSLRDELSLLKEQYNVQPSYSGRKKSRKPKSMTEIV